MSEPPSSRRSTRPVVAGLTDVGRQRKHNEDCVLIRSECGLFAVADGMGGHNAGDVASKLTTTSMSNFFEATQEGPLPTELPEDYENLAPGARRLVAAIRKANHDVFTISSTYQQHHGMGSTIVAMHLSAEDGIMHIAHVGDSRCYRIRDDEIQQLTRDHSLINDALEMKPDLLPEEIARLPKNIITRALGMKEVVKVDIRSEPTHPGDVFLLCSDGLSGMVSDLQILEVIGLTDDPQEACELLIAEANDAGGNDNISALIVRIEEERDEDSAPVLETREAMVSFLGLDEEGEESRSPELEIASEEQPYSGDLLEESPRSEPDRDADEDDHDTLTNGIPGELCAALEGASAESVEETLDLRGPWSNGPAQVQRCGQCNHEVYVGNLYCVECGTPIESADAS